MDLVRKIFQWIAANWLKKQFPAWGGVLDNLDKVFGLVLEAVSAAEATGQDGADKKKQASGHLLELLKANGIDIPGDADAQVCDVLIEGMVAALNGFLPQFSKK